MFLYNWKLVLVYNLAASLTSPIFSFGEYFFNTDSLWYYGERGISLVVPLVDQKECMEIKPDVIYTFQNCLDASLPATRFKIFAPPGCSSTNLVTSYTLLSTMMYRPLSAVLWAATSAGVNDCDMISVCVVCAEFKGGKKVTLFMRKSGVKRGRG